MKKKLAVILGLLLLVGLFVYLSKASLKTFFIKNTAESEKAQSTLVHKGHNIEEAPQEEEPPVVEIPLDKQQLIGVKTTVVSFKPMQKLIRTVGRIEYDERRIVTVNTKFEGWIEQLYVDYTGRYVEKGEPLIEIYSPELMATQLEFINLLKWRQSLVHSTQSQIQKMLLKDAESIIEATRHRLRLWDITEEQIKKIEETGKTIRTLTIFSPVSGYVIEKMVLKGMRVMPGDKLFDIADLSNIWVIADIYEHELPLINIGQAANINLSYLPGKEFRSTIEYLYPTLSGETRTAKIRFSLPNPEGKLKPQMYTDVTIKSDISKRLIIPADSIIDTGLRQIVYVDKGDGYFEPREIKTGIRADGFVEVIEGLKEGERIASSATFLIDAEAQLKGIKPLEHKH